MKNNISIDNLIFLLENLPNTGNWITNSDGDIIWVNDTACRITKYSRDELIGKNPRIVKSGLLPDDFYKDFWKTISSGKVWNGKFHNKDKQGNLFWAEITVIPITDSSGSIKYYVGSGSDVTEEHKAKNKLNDILDKVPDLISIFAKNKVCTQVYGNEMLTKFPHFGKITGKNIDEIEELTKDQIEILSKQFDTAENVGESVEVYNVKIGEEFRIFECTCKTFNGSQYILFWRDVTEFRQAATLRKFVSNLDKLMTQNRQHLQNIMMSKDLLKEYEDNVR